MTIGQKLSEKRRELGKTIKEIELVLKIRSSYLEALENDDFDKLPSPIYVRAFLADYASYLGLDKDKILAEFDAFYLPKPEEEKLKPSKLALPEWSGAFLALLFLAGLFSWGLYYLLSYTKTEAPIQKPQIKDKTTTPNPVQSVETTPPLEKTTSTENLAPVIPKKVTVEVRITGPVSWIRTIIDGEKVFEGIMRKGDKNKWEGEEVRLRIGNASSTEVKVNGKIVKLERTASGVVEKVFRGGNNE